MSYTYAKRKRAEAASPKTEAVETQGPSPEALRTGAAQPSPEQLGSRVDLPDAMRTKMENAFGADLSAVKLYESQAVADVGSQAITQGADIAFAPGLLDFSSFGGQALLGHELSHVVSQARGEVTGSGFLNDASLEARADREGAMAAAGRTVAPPTASLSPVSAADAAGPMQAKDKPEDKKAKAAASGDPGSHVALTGLPTPSASLTPMAAPGGSGRIALGGLPVPSVPLTPMADPGGSGRIALGGLPAPSVPLTPMADPGGSGHIALGGLPVPSAPLAPMADPGGAVSSPAVTEVDIDPDEIAADDVLDETTGHSEGAQPEAAPVSLEDIDPDEITVDDVLDEATGHSEGAQPEAEAAPVSLEDIDPDEISVDMDWDSSDGPDLFYEDESEEDDEDEESSTAGEDMTDTAAARSDAGSEGGKAAAKVPGAQEAAASEPGWEFASDPGEKQQLPSAGIGFVLGMENADSAEHGAEFREMMAGLNKLAMIKGNRRHMGSTTFDAMTGNVYDEAISGMQKYRDKLSQERGHFWERRRQIKFLNQMLRLAQADKQRNEARQSVTLPDEEFTSTILGGQVNSVYRYARNGHGAFFKPQTKTSNGTELDVMERVGIDPSREGEGPRLSEREIAFSRLGDLLGLDVTLGAKKANVGDTGLTGKSFLGGKEVEANTAGSKVFQIGDPESDALSSGVLMEEAKGTSWMDYNWDFLSLAPKKEHTATAEELLQGASEVGDTWNLGERLDDYGFGLRHKKTTAPNFRGKLFGFKPESQTLDMANPGFQRQMNQLFLLDTLAAHTDRHTGNFNISVDAANAIHVHAIDNDLTFGTLGGDEEHAAEFGKRGYSANYGGLPTKMQIDADTAKKIESMTRQQLDLTFSDLLSKKEIDALWFRFQMLKKYIEDMREEGLIVDKWDKKTARREVQLAGGLGSHLNEVDDEVGGGYAGNNYYQRQMLMLNALDIDTTHERREGLLQAAAYGYRKDRPSKT